MPDGWLGFICGAKLFFEFSPKYKFEDEMAKDIFLWIIMFSEKKKEKDLNILSSWYTKIMTFI